MKTKKPDTHTAMRRLFQATSDIVAGVRKVHADAGMPSSGELRVPVLFQGTDMRVVIEAGPGVAMRNVVENAQMKASDKPVNEPGLNAKQEAMTLLAMYASELQDANCTDGQFTDPAEKAFFNRVVDAIKALDLPEGMVKT